MTKKMVLFVMMAAACAGGLLWYAAVRVDAPAPTAQAAAQQVRPVPTAEVLPLPDTSVREFPASVQAVRRVDMSFSVDGVLVTLHGEAGRSVAKGEVVARLDPRDFRNAVDAAQAAYDEATSNLARTSALYERKVTAKAELDTIQAAYDTTKAQLRIKRKALEDTVMRAPFDSVVARRYVENHEYVSRNTPVLSLQSVSDLEVAFQVPESLLARWGNAAVGHVQVRVEAGGDWRDAAVREVNADADSETRTYEVTAAVQAPPGMKLLPGMTATARLVLPEAPGADGAVLAPMAAVFGGDDGLSYVWVVADTPAAPVRTRVELGGMREDGVVVRSGLRAGQRVAVAGVHTLTGEMRVRPMQSGHEGMD